MRRPSPIQPSRRGVLLGAAGVLLAGCTRGVKVGSDGPGRPGPNRRTDGTTGEAAERVDPDVALAATALAAEQAVLAVVLATQDRHLSLREALEPAAEAHRAHVALLEDAVPKDAPAESPPTTPPRVPGSPARAVARLTELEDELDTNGRRHAFAAESGPFARLLASMAASAGQQAAVLRDLDVGRGRR